MVFGATSSGHHVVERQQLVGVRVGEGRAHDPLGIGLPRRLAHDQGRRQVAHIGGVVLDPDRGGRPVDLDVGVEPDLLVDPGLQQGAEAPVAEEDGEEFPPAHCAAATTRSGTPISSRIAERSWLLRPHSSR